MPQGSPGGDLDGCSSGPVLTSTPEADCLPDLRADDVHSVIAAGLFSVVRLFRRVLMVSILISRLITGPVCFCSPPSHSFLDKATTPWVFGSTLVSSLLFPVFHFFCTILSKHVHFWNYILKRQPQDLNPQVIFLNRSGLLQTWLSLSLKRSFRLFHLCLGTWCLSTKNFLSRRYQVQTISHLFLPSWFQDEFEARA